jgi:hypothetical protein
MSFVLALALGISSGMNPYVTVAITMIVAERSDLLKISLPDPISANTVLVVALILLPLDIFGDKFSSTGRLVDRIGWIVKPITGGVLGGIVLGTSDAGIAIGISIGAAAGLLTYGLRLRVRERIQERMLGFGRIVIGAYGDFGSGIITMVAILWPPAGLTIAIGMISLALFADDRWGQSKPVSSS